MMLVFGVALVVGGLLVNGWAISMLWGWFVVPLFGTKSLTIANAIGLSCFVSLFTASSAKKEEDDLGTMIARVLIVPVLIVFIGWIVSLGGAA